MGELENAVMEQLWRATAPCTVREIHESLARERSLAYTTVMTVMVRLTAKGLVTQARDARAFRYAPARSQEQVTADLMLDALSASSDPGARAVALQHFVGQVGPAEAEALRQALTPRA